MAGYSYVVRSAMALWIAGLVTAVDLGRAAADAAVHKVGEVTRHPRKFIDQGVVLTGYVLARESDYVLFSDEPTGRVSAHDLPVTGAGFDRMKPMKKYRIEGIFRDHGLKANNGSDYHLELTAEPGEAKP
jgi:hypothetical protein